MRGRNPRFIACLLPCALWFSPSLLAAPGDWDRSFAQDGRLPLANPSITFNVRDWVRQPDGKVIAVGHSVNTVPFYSENNDYVVARVNVDGSPDTSFDGDGFVRFDFGSAVYGTANLARQADGKILVVGQAGPDWSRARLLRLNVDGSRDTTYGPAGEFELTYPSGGAIRNPTMVLAADGAALVMGSYDTPAPMQSSGVVITRVTSTGVLDTTFGTGGSAIFLMPGGLYASEIAVAADGKIYLGGTLGDGPAVGRITSNGQLDVSFGVGGVSTLGFLFEESWIGSLAPMANGQIVVTGQGRDGNDSLLPYLARLNSNGTLDAGFGSNGRNVVAAEYVTSIMVEGDGKIVAAGSSAEQTSFAVLMRYNSDGSPDVTFGRRGLSRTDLATGILGASSGLSKLRRNADGSYDALTQTYDNDQFGFFIARFLAAGPGAGVLGIRAQFEGTTTGGNSAVSESTPKQRFTVSRTGGYDGTVNVQYRTVSGTAIAGKDFVAKSGTITLNDGESIANIDIDVIDDNVPEINFNESFYVELFNVTGGAGISKQRASVELFRDDDYGSRIEIHGGGNVLEGGPARFLLARSGSLADPLTVNYAVTGDTATAGSDFDATGGSVQWAANQGGVREVSIPLLDDNDVESNEVLTVAFTESSGVAVISSPEPVVINDNDGIGSQSMVALASMYTYVDEGAGTASVIVNRLGDTSQALSLPYSFSTSVGPNVATPGQDYTTSTSGSVSWAIGESGPKTISVPITDDSSTEFPEAFALSIAASYPIVSPGNLAFVWIKDNDGLPSQPVFSLGAGSNVDEGAGSVTVPVTLTGNLAGNVGVSLEVTLGSAAGNDVSVFYAPLTWTPASPAVRNISIPITDDTRDETDETFSVRLSNASGGARLGTTTVANFTITDNDATPVGAAAPLPPGIQAVSTTVTVNENQRSAILELQRVGDPSGYLSAFYFGTDGTATGAADYFVRPGSVLWSPNQTDIKRVEIQINGDSVMEPTESMSLGVSPYQGTDAGANFSVPLTITDDDAPAPPARVGFITATSSVAESATAVSVQVGRTGNTDVASSVDYAMATGSAVAADFTAASGTLTWVAGDTSSKTITVTLLPDTVDEADENFTITLSNPSSGTQLDTAIATLTIQDDDEPPAPPPPPPPSPPPPSGSSSGGGSSGGGGGGGGAESYLGLLMLAAVLMVRMRKTRRIS